MRKANIIYMAIVLIFVSIGCNKQDNTIPPLPGEFPIIQSNPDRWTTGRGALSSMPFANPEELNPFAIDLRSYDLSGLDLRHSYNDLIYSVFNSQTTWPSINQLPNNFAWEFLLDLGRNPGLGVRDLHERGITGNGVGIGIIDQVLLIEHIEYVDQLQYYAEMEDVRAYWGAQIHGPAVASIAAGDTVGVAPGADLYYIATGFWGPDGDHAILAQAIRELIEVNNTLPEERRIRVISISYGWGTTVQNYEDLAAALEDAIQANIFIIASTLIPQPNIYFFMGAGRNPFNDPDDFTAYQPGYYWIEEYANGNRNLDMLWIPTDARTTASATGENEYVYYGIGGMSWAIPYVAGVYALSVQVDPSITPDIFWDIAMETSILIKMERDSRFGYFGPIINPVGIIETLQEN